MTLAPEKLEENPLLEGLRDRTHAGVLRARHLRRLRRPDAARSSSRRSTRSPSATCFRELRRARRCAHGRHRRGIPRGDEVGRPGARRAIRSARTSGRPSPKAMRYLDMDFGDDASWNKVTRTLADIDKNLGTGGNRVYYFAVPPPVIGTLVEEIGKRRAKRGWTRLVIEKPFGHDLESAQELNALLAKDFDESEVFRIDHYLGKETVQNMLALRFANGIFEPVWNRQFIDHVQITVAESIGIENRAGVLRAGGRHPRRLPEPPAAARRADRDGAADRLQRRVGAQREGQGAALVAHARAEARRPRPVRARLDRGRGGAGLPRRGGRRPRLDDRHLHRREALRRQLALGRHAVLRARGQAARPPRDDDRDPVPARAASAVRGDRGRGAAAERARRPRPARRGRLAVDRREGARRRDDDQARAHGLPLRRDVPRRGSRRRTSG